jgi:hypothetical protein
VKKLLALLTLALVVFVVVYRQRLFLWDPIASVTRGGAKVSGVRAMINYSNDVLVQDKGRMYLVQQWDSTAKTTVGPLKCVKYLACMTDADHAAGEAIKPGGRVSMTSKAVEFVDENGAAVRVVLW